MTETRKNADDQAVLWNSTAGQAWVDAQDTLDQMFRAIEEQLVEVAATKPRSAVLDVGCGTGSVIIAIQTRLGAESACVGIDISRPMLDSARQRAARAGAPVRFLAADAERHDFGEQRFDLIVSRFGVMFFDDPVRALDNLRRHARADAELCFFVWRSPADNPFMTTAERAAAPLLPSLPPRDPDAPGQFAFADPNKVRRILEQSGWQSIDLQPVDIPCTFIAEDLSRYVTRLGPLGRVLNDTDEPTRERIVAAVMSAFQPFISGGTVRFDAACWKIEARAS